MKKHFSIALLFLTTFFHSLVYAQQDAPDALFEVLVRNGSSVVEVHSPATSWNRSSSDEYRNSEVSGSTTSTSLNGVFNATADVSDYPFSLFSGEGQGMFISTWIKNGASVQYTVNVSGDASVSTSDNVDSASAPVSLPFVDGAFAEKPFGEPAGSHADTAEFQLNNFANLRCASNAQNEGCKTFPEYPGVLYCKPPNGTRIPMSSTFRHNGARHQNFTLSALGNVSITATLGSAAPTAILGDTYVDGEIKIIPEAGDTIVVPNESYDSDDQLGTTPGEGICSFNWQVLKNGNVIAGSDTGNPEFRAGTPGDYVVTLEVTDNEGETQGH